MLATLCLLTAIVYAASASADSSEDSPGALIPPSAIEEAANKEPSLASLLTDPQAAARMPHRDLNRSEALELMQAVFGPELRSPAGSFDDLHIETFLSDNVGVIAAGDQPSSSGVSFGGGEGQDQYHGPTLIESTLPLRTDGSSPGEEKVVDLGLEHSEGELQPSNPLVEVGIPQELGDGIEFPGTGVRLNLTNAPEQRSPSVISQSVAAYPEVASDTTLVVAPVPAGFETMTLLQSAEAPTSQTFQLDLPQGADLEEMEDGGAVVSSGEKTLLRVLPPAAIDATGADVPVDLEVASNSLTLKVSPEASSTFPILVDPTYLWHESNVGNISDWVNQGNTSALIAGAGANCSTPCPPGIQGSPGLDLLANKGASIPANSGRGWSFYVPRYFDDIAQYGAPPQSFVTSMVLQNLAFWSGAQEASFYPALSSGIWDEIGQKYTSQWGHSGDTDDLTNLASTYTFGYGGDQNAKRAIAAYLYSNEAHTMAKGSRQVYVGGATVEVGDSGSPSFGTPTPTFRGWVNNKPNWGDFNFTVSDAGLGLKSIRVQEEASPNGPPKSWSTQLSCGDWPSNACPRTWKSSDSSLPMLTYEPKNLPQGEYWVELIAADLVQNKTAQKVKVRIDHTAPSLSLSGSMTEQATNGPSRPRYVLKAVSADGTEAAPQSGIVSTEVTVDGKTVDSTAAGCATKNCSVSREWTLESSAYAIGKHVVAAKATDGVGLTTEKTLTIEIQRDTTKPTIDNFGLLYNAPDGWVEQKTYPLLIVGGDYGYGVTSLEFKMDGSVIKSAKVTCPNGGCSESLNVSVNMANYKGGAHAAEVVATDGAGNVGKYAWTVNVNPKGVVTTPEAIKTLEAVEVTNETQPIAPATEVVEKYEREEGNTPGLKKSGEELVSTGTAAAVTMPADPSKGLVIKGAEGSVTIEPMAGGATPSEIAEGVAAISPNTSGSVDTITRPIYEGAMTFETLRDTVAPEEFSWEVSLRSGQKLISVDSSHATIYNKDGESALAITAETAHDATGKAVQTELKVLGTKVLVLTVKHRGGGFVYPIIGGPAFQSSYVMPIVYTPPPPPPPGGGPWTTEQLNGILFGPQTIVEVVSGPQFTECPEGDACASSSAPLRKYGLRSCVWVPLLDECTVYEQKIKGFFYYNGDQAWWSKRQPQCEDWVVPGMGIKEDYCSWVGPNHQKYGDGYHITSQVRYHLISSVPFEAENTKYITVRMFGDGYVRGHETGEICNPSRPEC